MTHTLTQVDRLRIERAVWTFDSRLQDLPRKTRVAKRRELRSNLRAAAADVGAVEALRRLGNMRRLAAEYLVAEYGQGGPRPSWLSGFAFVVVTVVFLSWLLDAGTSAFTAGVLTAIPHATGTFHWQGIPYVLNHVTIKLVDGNADPSGGASGGAWTPLVYVFLFAGATLVGRLWRLLPAWRRRANTIDNR